MAELLFYKSQAAIARDQAACQAVFVVTRELRVGLP
jgi:hypothetical protein